MRTKTTAACLLSITTLLVSLADSQAALVKGAIKALDTEVGTISVTTGPKGKPVTQTFNLKSPNIPVLSEDGKKAKLLDLKPGLPVTLQLTADDDVEAIVARAPVRSGTLLAIDTDKKMLKLDGGKKGEDADFVFSDTTEVTVYGHKKTLLDLRAGQQLLLVLTLDQQKVISAVASLKRGKDDPRGAIVEVDPARNSITLLASGDGNFRFSTWPVAPGFLFIFDDVECAHVKLADLPLISKLHDLPKAPPTWLRLGGDGKTVAAVVAEPAITAATLQAVDPEKNTVEVRFPKGELASFVVEKGADIRILQRKVSLAELSAGMPATISLSYQPGRLVGIRARKE